MDLLYLGGGYPELYAESLAANVAMQIRRADIQHAGQGNLCGCGGLMYLTEAIPRRGRAPTRYGRRRACRGGDAERRDDVGVSNRAGDSFCLLGLEGTELRGMSSTIRGLSPPATCTTPVRSRMPTASRLDQTGGEAKHPGVV